MAEAQQLSPEESPVVNFTSESQTFEEIIQSVNDAEIEHLLKNARLFRLFCEKLLIAFQNLEKKEAAFENLLNVIQRISVRCDGLLQSIEMWLPNRQKLLSLVAKDASTMNVMSKVCNTGRVISSIVDSGSQVASLLVGESSNRYANIAFQTASVLGVLGFTASAVELYNWKAKLERLVKELQIDQQLFSPIQDWFRQNNDLEEAMKRIFPFEKTGQVVKEFQKVMNNQLSQAELLQVVLGPILREDGTRFRDVALIRNLVAFATCPAARDWCRWIILRHHREDLDINSMLLRLISPQRFASSQNIAAVAGGSQIPMSVSAFTRIGLNALTIYDAVNTLKNGGMVDELKKLQNHLQMEMVALQQISRLIEIRRTR